MSIRSVVGPQAAAWLLIVAFTLAAPSWTYGEPDCGTATRFLEPVRGAEPGQMWGVAWTAFGEHYPDPGQGGFHPGEDWNLVTFSGDRPISVDDSGKRVYAIGPGIVRRAISRGTVGDFVVVEHSGVFTIPASTRRYTYPAETVTKLYSAYLHITRSQGLVENVTCVSADTELGKIMNPGKGPHLHFEIRHPSQRTGGTWTMLGEPGNWVGGAANATGYYHDVQKMVEAGARHPRDILAANSGIQVSAISPTRIVQSDFDLTIEGDNLEDVVDQVFWKNDGRLVGNGQILSRTASRLVVRQKMSGASPGTYEVRVKNAQGQLSAPFDLEIAAAASTQLTLRGAVATVVDSFIEVVVEGSGFADAVDEVRNALTGERLVGAAQRWLGFTGARQLLFRYPTGVPGVGPNPDMRPASTDVRRAQAALGGYEIRLRNANGAVSNFVPVQSDSGAPAIASVSPNELTASPASRTLQILGTNFRAPTRVFATFAGGGVELPPAAIRAVTHNSIQIVGTLANPGTYSLRVQNPNGQSSGPFSFVVAGTPVGAPSPVITALNPLVPNASPIDRTLQLLGGGFRSPVRVLVTFPGGSVELPPVAIGTVTNGVVEILGTLANPGLYSLRVVNPDGQASNVWPFSVGPRLTVNVPGPPSGLTVEIDGTSVVLRWNPPTNGGSPTHYIVEAGTSPGAMYLSMPTGGTSTFSLHTGVPPGRYHVRVRAANGAGTGEPSNEQLVQVGTPAAAQPPGYSFELSANAGWRTVREVTAGRMVTIDAAGQWRTEPGRPFTGPSGDSANPCVSFECVVLMAPQGLLLGRIGSGTPFVVGAEVQFVAPSNGVLSLTINDRQSGLADNVGSIFVLALQSGDAVPELPPYGCSLEPQARSVAGVTHGPIEFVNLSSQTRKLYWLNYSGQRVFYANVAAGQSSTQNTYLTHPWLVTNAQDQCVALFSPIAGGGRAVLR